MKKSLVVSLLFMSFVCVHAQRMKSIWLSMPDSLIGYINQSKRIEAMDYRDMGLKLDVKNLLDGSTLVDTLTNDFMEVRFSSASTLQMKLLAVADSDSVLCVVRTLKGPEPESKVSFYNLKWEKQPLQFTMPEARQLVQKPDTMTSERFEELFRMIEPPLLNASLNIDDDTLLVGLSAPMLNKEEREAVKAILRQRKLKWNGETFK